MAFAPVPRLLTYCMAMLLLAVLCLQPGTDMLAGHAAHAAVDTVQANATEAITGIAIDSADARDRDGDGPLFVLADADDVPDDSHGLQLWSWTPRLTLHPQVPGAHSWREDASLPTLLRPPRA